MQRSIQKKQNAHRPVVERIRKLYEHGLGVAGGFILGFDGEDDGTDEAIIGCIEAADIIFALVGLLIACPKTQLADRLQREGRLLDPSGNLIPPGVDGFRVSAEHLTSDHFDTSTVGLNFVTSRDRATILEEFANVIRTIYVPEVYFRRVTRAAGQMAIRRKHRPGGKELWKFMRGGWRAAVQLTRNPCTRKHLLNAMLQCSVMGPRKLEYAMMAMSFFLHSDRQTAAMLKEIDQRYQQALTPSEPLASTTGNVVEPVTAPLN